MEKCSIVVPCYNEEDALPLFYEETQKVVETMTELEFEYLFVDDGSKDGTINIMRELSEKDSNVHYVSFSRNFGKEAAIFAGLQNATGDYVVIMDADLQDPPDLLPEMFKAVTEEGYDCAATRRVNRKGEPPIRSLFAKLFYKIMNRMAKVDMVDGARDFRFMKRTMVDAICSIGEYNRFSKGIFGWVGFNTKWLEFKNRERVAGKTKWSFWSLFKYSIEGMVAFSTAPLLWTSFIGLFFCVVAFIALVVLFVRAALFGDPVSGWPSLACMITFFAGLQLFCIGIIGVYLSKAYLEIKGRPVYIVREKK
ncbi:MAG: glycosyltransferase family 2 protein [Lachnospiraceae bacterium]|nr:glycosyltransferase family 2 protein [Lachnospiraceae bacterium]